MRGENRGDAPGLLSRPVDAAPPLAPLRGDPALAAIHQQWARVHAHPTPGAVPSGGPGAAWHGWRTRLRQAVTRAALEAQRPALADDRALLGDLIRAADALATRCDVLADRVADLEHSLAEVVDVLGADLTRLRAELAAGRDPASPPPHG